MVLTGMGADGFEGCKDLNDSGAVILAQDKDTSVVWGMPGVVAEHELATKVLPVQQIPSVMSGLVDAKTVVKKRAA